MFLPKASEICHMAVTGTASASVAIPHDAEADIEPMREHEPISPSSEDTESEAPGHAEDYRRMDDEGKGKRKGKE